MDRRLEKRYIVIKLKHLDHIRRVELDDFLQDNDIQTVDGVVVESDQAIYPKVVDMVLGEE